LFQVYIYDMNQSNRLALVLLPAFDMINLTDDDNDNDNDDHMELCKTKL